MDYKMDEAMLQILLASPWSYFPLILLCPLFQVSPSEQRGTKPCGCSAYRPVRRNPHDTPPAPAAITSFMKREPPSGSVSRTACRTLNRSARVFPVTQW